MGLVGATVNRMSPYLERHNVDPEDARQTGYMALCLAADGFNPDAGYQFSTYATKVIRTEIMKDAVNGALVRVPPESTRRYGIPTPTFVPTDESRIPDRDRQNPDGPSFSPRISAALSFIPHRQREAFVRCALGERVGDVMADMGFETRHALQTDRDAATRRLRVALTLRSRTVPGAKCKP